MRVFLTGATGFIGSRIVPELLAAGHEVVGMTRSEAGAKSLLAAGASVHRATLEDTASVMAGAADADAVIHTAFDHDFSNFVANCEKDRRVIEALGSVLKGSDRPLLVTSGTGVGDAGDGRGKGIGCRRMGQGAKRLGLGAGQKARGLARGFGVKVVTRRGQGRDLPLGRGQGNRLETADAHRRNVQRQGQTARGRTR